MLYIYSEYYKKNMFLEGIEGLTILPLKNNTWPEIEFGSDDRALYLPQSNIRPPKWSKNMYGSLKGVDIAKNKCLARKVLQESGFSVPKTWFNIEDAKFPFIARPNRHSFGEKFYIIKNNQDKRKLIKERRITKDWYFSSIVDIRKEYRVMVLENEIFLVYNRQLFRSLERTLRKREMLRRTQSFRRRECEKELNEEAKNLCIDAMEHIGLAYGAVDLAIDKHNKPYILEINTSPMLDSSFVQKYLKEAIEKLAKKGV